MSKLLVLLALISCVAVAQDKPQAPPAPTQEQIQQANERMAMLRQQRDEAADQIALLRIKLQHAAGSAAIVTGTDAKGTWAIHRQNTAGITTAQTIATGVFAGEAVWDCHVYGSATTNRFFDHILVNSFAGTVAVILATTINGSPAARTFAFSGSALTLAMASGTYNVNTYCLEANSPN